MIITPPRFDVRADAARADGFSNLRPWLFVRAQADATRPVEILIIGSIGKNWYDEGGVDQLEFRAALRAVPKGQPITIGINSQGGSVEAGLGIYNEIRNRGGGVTTRNDGYAVSIASVILCAGDTVVSPRTAAVMIHDPWAMVVGNADDMEAARGSLEVHAELLVAAYTLRTGKQPDVIRAAMKAETWFSGESAKAWGLIDSLTDAEPDLVTLASEFDPQKYRSAPAHVLSIWNSSGRRPAFKHSENRTEMNRNAILALLNKHGVAVAADANDAALLAAVNKLVDESKVEAWQRDEIVNPTSAPAITSVQATHAGHPQPAPVQAAVVDMGPINARIAVLETENNRLQLEGVERRVDAAISEFRIPASQRDKWVRRAAVDASILQDIQALPQRLPGAAPVAEIEVANSSAMDLAKHFGRLSTSACASMLRGNPVTPQEIQSNAVQASIFYDKHRSRILEVLNANTIPAELQRNVTLQEVVRAFARILLPFRAFSTVFSNVPLLGTNKISVPYYPLVTAASTTFVAANGYVMGDSTINAKEITIDKRLYQPIRFDSSELARQPAINMGEIVAAKASKLAFDVFADTFSIVTAANYGASVFTGVASTFDSVDIADLKGVADVANWPMEGRSLILKSAYDVNVLKDASVKAAYAFGSAEPIRLGSIPSIFGLDYYVVNALPSNGENLVGVLMHKSAILFATSPIMPADEVRAQLSAYEVVTNAETGISFEYRRWGNPDMDQRREVIECNYGYEVGEVAGLERLVSV